MKKFADFFRVIGIWLITACILYGTSILIHRSSTVLIFGGANNSIVSSLLALLTFGIVFCIACRKQKISAKSLSFITSILIVFSGIAYLIAFKFLLGFFPWQVTFAMTSDMKFSIILQIVLFIAMAFVGALIGRKMSKLI